MLRQRVITALVLVAIILPTLVLRAPEPFAWFALVLAAAGTWEWARLSGLSSWAGVVWGLVLAAAGGWALAPAIHAQFPTGFWWTMTLTWVLLCLWLFRAGPARWASLPAVLRMAWGLLAMGATWLALAQCRGVGVNFLLSLMAVVWASDIAAYFAGRRWGRRKLAPTLSPGKTWEGVAGACAGALLLGVLWLAVESRVDLGAPSVFRLVWSTWGLPALPVVVGVLVALGVAGDLFESLMKRAVGMKDSSGLLPGHGGVLDRVDALLPVLPMGMVLLQWRG